MRWAVAFGCGVGLFTLAMVFQGAVPPAAIAAIGVGAFGLGFLRPPPLHSLLAFLIGLSVTLVAALWFSRAAASCVLFPLAFTALHGFLFAPTRDPGRPKSLLAEAQLRQVFFRAAAVVFAISLPACMLVRPRWYHAAALASSFMVASVAWLSAVRALGRLLSLAARVTPAQHGEPREPGRELDVGIGDEGYAVDAKAAGPYRGVAS
ncbi:MAG: hypothetical protein JNK04_13700, partial [Myxococcales bacterium]|nr:hypothetical protein [Myxococcales bacterium]